MRTDRLLAVVLLVLAGCDDAPERQEGFAGLGVDAAAFQQVTPGRVFGFPADHAAHDGFRVEWWYLTANLKDPQGRAFGVQWTLFRNALQAGSEQPGWASQVIWLGHAAVTSATVHHAAERYARGGVGQAGVQQPPFAAWIDDWRLSSQTGSDNPLADMRLQASGKGFSYQLRLTSSRPVVLHGEQGFSRKSEQGQASYYYSQPFFAASGSLEIDGTTYQVSGPAWLDREWSSQPLMAGQSGWDWFSLHLDSGAQLMLFRIRQQVGAPYVTGTWINPDGSTRTLSRDEISLTPLTSNEVAGRSLPTRWSVKVPGKGLDITVAALNPKAWMDLRIAYWEGPVQVNGSDTGVGYLEMTGY